MVLLSSSRQIWLVSAEPVEVSRIDTKAATHTVRHRDQTWVLLICCHIKGEFGVSTKIGTSAKANERCYSFLPQSRKLRWFDHPSEPVTLDPVSVYYCP